MLSDYISFFLLFFQWSEETSISQYGFIQLHGPETIYALCDSNSILGLYLNGTEKSFVNATHLRAFIRRTRDRGKHEIFANV